MAAIQQKLRYADIPEGLRGFGINMITTGLMAIGFMLFAGISLS
jgi:Na+-transporting NADH:ubiquinone oxidoreductase subunit E